MNKDAIYSDGTADYVEPPMPLKGQKTKITLRTKKDELNFVYLVSETNTLRMRKEETKGLFSYYSVGVWLEEDVFRYYFRIEDANEACYYNRCGVTNEVIPDYSFEIIPGFSTPEWACAAVMYQIYVDRFCNGDSSNDVENMEYYYLGGYSEKVEDWYRPPASKMAVCEFYGGDLRGIIDKLDYLQDLGIEVLYLNPIFVSPSNHKYDIQDYEGVDPHYGVISESKGVPLSEGDTCNKHATKYQERVTNPKNIEASNALLEELITELHRRNMRIILDGVFNHCGSFNKWLDREKIYEGRKGYPPGAYLSYESPYHDYFHFLDNDPSRWPDNPNYEGWWGHDTLPKLNYEESDTLRRKVLDIGKKWVKEPYNIDGWRLDVAADLGASSASNHEFWKEFRKEIKGVNKDAMILAEHYGDPKDWLSGDEWDTVMNYDAFMEPVSWFLTGMEKHSDENRMELKGNGDYFVKEMTHHMTRMPYPSLYMAMNQVSNHDHSRFLTRTNAMVGRVDTLGSDAAGQFVNLAVFKEAVVIQMTWVGAPTLYYGDEVGVCGFTDPDNRRTFPWGRENKELLTFHRVIIGIHKQEEVLKKGSLKILSYGKDMLAYVRFNGKEQIVIILNNKDTIEEITIPVWPGGVPPNGRMKRIFYTYDGGIVTDNEEYIVREGNLVLNMGAYSAILLKSEAED